MSKYEQTSMLAEYGMLERPVAPHDKPSKRKPRGAGRTSGPGGGPGKRTQLDRTKAQKARDKGMQRAEQHAPEGWGERAYAAVERCARERPRFIVDAVWEYMDPGDVPPEPRAMGPVIRRAAMAKPPLIESTREYEDSARVTAHYNPRRIWRSKIYEDGA